MNRDELREKMVDWLSGDLTGLDRYLPEDKITYLINRQLSLLAPILDDAERWRKVKESADSCFCPMQECPLYKRCIDLPCLAELVVDALDEKEEKE